MLMASSGKSEIEREAEEEAPGVVQLQQLTQALFILLYGWID